MRKKTIIIVGIIILLLVSTVAAQAAIAAKENRHRNELMAELIKVQEERDTLKFQIGAIAINTKDRLEAADNAIMRMAHQEEIMKEATTTVEATHGVLVNLIEYTDTLQKILTENNIPFPALLLDTDL